MALLVAAGEAAAHGLFSGDRGDGCLSPLHVQAGLLQGEEGAVAVVGVAVGGDLVAGGGDGPHLLRAAPADDAGDEEGGGDVLAR